MVVHPNKRQRAATGSGAGMVFVKFFGTHDFAFCETLLSWDSPDATALKSKMPSKKLQKVYLLALAEAEAEVAHPTPVEPNEEEEDVAAQDDEAEAGEADEEEEGDSSDDGGEKGEGE